MTHNDATSRFTLLSLSLLTRKFYMCYKYIGFVEKKMFIF